MSSEGPPVSTEPRKDTPAPSAGAEPGAEQQEPPGRVRRSRRVSGRLLAAALGALGVVVVLIVLVASGVLGAPAPAPDPVLLPTPTPTLAPVEREAITPFQRALPDTVVQYAVAGQEEDFGLIDDGAVEAYLLTYRGDDLELTLRAGQYATVDSAVAAGAALEPGPGGELVREEAVLVGGDEVGRLSVAVGEDAARAVWTNGATLFVLQGPAAAVETFYDAFPM